MPVRCRLDQLSRDPHTVSRTQHRPLDDAIHAQLPGDVRQGWPVRALVAHRRRPRNHFQRTDLGEVGDQRLGHAVHKVLLLRVTREVAQWEQRLKLLTTGSYTEQRIAYHIGHLVLQLLAYEERLPIRAVIYNLETGTFDMPENVRQYILNGIGMGSMRKSLSFMQRIQKWLKQVIFPKKKVHIVSQYKDILPTIQFIENKLQIIEAGSDGPPEMQKTPLSEVSYVE